MKYRRLSNEELQELEKEFINYLAANTVTGQDWEQMKKNDLPATEGHIEAFSDIVMQKVLERVDYLEIVTSKDWKLFHCQKEVISLFCLNADTESEVDFIKEKLTPETLEELNLYTAEKPYKGERELEIYQMIENGCTLSDGKFYESLKANFVE